MAGEKPDELQQVFASYVKMTNPPDDRPQEGSRRWNDLLGALMAGGQFMLDVMERC